MIKLLEKLFFRPNLPPTEPIILQPPSVQTRTDPEITELAKKTGLSLDSRTHDQIVNQRIEEALQASIAKTQR